MMFDEDPLKTLSFECKLVSHIFFSERSSLSVWTGFETSTWLLFLSRTLEKSWLQNKLWCNEILSFLNEGLELPKAPKVYQV